MLLLNNNHPLHAWEQFETDRSSTVSFHAGGKKLEKMAQTIVSSLSHQKAVELVARDFHLMPEVLRIQVRTLCHNDNMSGNVRKGVLRLNALMKGELLKKETSVRVNERVEGRDGAFYKQRNVNPAVAGAAQKYGIDPRAKKRR